MFDFSKDLSSRKLPSDLPPENYSAEAQPKPEQKSKSQEVFQERVHSYEGERAPSANQEQLLRRQLSRIENSQLQTLAGLKTAREALIFGKSDFSSTALETLFKELETALHAMAKLSPAPSSRHLKMVLIQGGEYLQEWERAMDAEIAESHAQLKQTPDSLFHKQMLRFLSSQVNSHRNLLGKTLQTLTKARAALEKSIQRQASVIARTVQRCDHWQKSLPSPLPKEEKARFSKYLQQPTTIPWEPLSKEKQAHLERAQVLAAQFSPIEQRLPPPEGIAGSPLFGIYLYLFNTQIVPFTHVKVRQAFALAVNRAALMDKIGEEGEAPALSLLPPLMQLDKKQYFHDGDLLTAQALFQEGLRELGLTVGELPPLRLSYHTGEVHQRIARTLQQQWSKAFGVKIQLEQAEEKVHLDNLLHHHFALGHLSWVSTYYDPHESLSHFRQQVTALTQWMHPLFAALIEQSADTEDDYAYRRLLQQAEELLMKEMPLIPLFFLTSSFLKNFNVEGIYV